MESKCDVKPNRQGNRCICGRNLDYPLKEDGKYIVCRCGRKHKK